MPGLTVPRRRQRNEEPDDDEETSNVSREPTPLSQASNGSKRIRLDRPRGNEDDDDDNEEGSGADDGSDAESSTQDDSGQAIRSQPQPMHSVRRPSASLASGFNKDGYKPGAIVRIKLTDFVTYTSAEFFPGPKLNMVIGPNGTGKSTLVCAICLGLGWGPQHLGRAKDPGEFVKHGCREATIEIELAGAPRFRRNPVICRTIKREGNKSTFTLNGKIASRAQVLKLAQSFSIQIDNLCQFLPQDKVSEFAALTPVELLLSTERAAAGPEMVDMHENLKKLRAEQKKLQTDNQGNTDLLANLENRQEMQRADVERMRQRGEIKRKIEMLETARPIVKYKAHHKTFLEARAQRETLARELEQLKRELEPALRAVNAKQVYTSQLDEVIQYQKQVVERADATASEKGKKIEQLEDQMKDLNNQIDAEKKSGSQHRQELNKVQQTINKLRRQLNEEQPEEVDLDYYSEKQRSIRVQVREIKEKTAAIMEERQPLFLQLKDRTDRIKEEERQLNNLESQSGQQETKLQRLSNDSYKAYRWILENKDKFEKEVFGPPIVSCSIRDPKYADAVESLFQRTDLMAFTTQTRNDFKTLQKFLSIEMRLHDISIRTCSIPLDNLRAPLSDDELRELGFDGWAKDFLSGPEPVLAMLCSENRLHQTPVVLRDVSDEEFTRMEKHGTISSWVAGKHSYQVVRRREYGPSATSTRVRQIKPARVWTSQPVDVSAKRELELRIQGWKEEQRELQEKIDSDRAKVAQLKKDYEALEEERNDLEQEKAAKQTALTNYRAIPEKINQQEAKQRDIKNFFDEIRERVMNIRSQQDQISIQKAEATVEYANAVEQFRQSHEELLKLQVRHIEALSDFETLKDRNAQYREMLEAKNREVKEASTHIKSLSEAGKELLKRAEAVMALSNSSQPDLKPLLITINHHTVDQLEADIDSEKARLELTHGGSANIIKEFEDRERQIQRLRTKLADFERQLSDYEHAINEIRGQWEPKLEALVKKISDAFSDSFTRIGCAGQVSLDKAEDEPGPNGQSSGSDFDQWSIQIHVKFRENESLSLLDAHRQSGGERAVSTIFYLMALQSLSASPFRVVDEINQGMDPRNERMVHERLVDIACDTGEDSRSDADGVGGGGGGQYFLITPKLLSGLAYKPGMKVLCIVSGEHMPEDYDLLDFGRAVKQMKEVVARSKGKGKARALPGTGIHTRGSSSGVDVGA